MEDKELEITILKINQVLSLIENVNVFAIAKDAKTIYQKNINSAYSTLFDLKRHLEFVRKGNK